MPESLPVDLSAAHEEIRRLRAETARLRSQLAHDPRDLERLESEQQLRILFEHAALAVILGDFRTGRAIAVNPAFERMLGYVAEDVSFERIRSISHPEDEPKEAALLQEMLSGQRRYYCLDKRFFHRDGHVVWGRITASLVRDAQDQPRFYVGMIEDINERKQAEEALKRSNALLTSQQEAAIDGILLVDEQQRVISYNQRFCEIWRLSGDLVERRDDRELIGKVMQELADPTAFKERVEYLYRHPQEASRDEVRLKDGRVFDRYSAPARSEDGQLYGRIWYFRDMTDRKRLEEELKAQNEELKELDRLKSSFVDSVSHELRTPLTSIKGYAEFLEDEMGGSLSADQHGFVAQIVAGASRLERLVDDLLDFARMEAGTFKLAVRDFDLREMLVRVVESFRPQAQERKLTVETAVPPGPVWVTGDPGRIEQVFMNLMGNALKFTFPSGHVIARLTASDTAARVEIQDTGLGVSPEKLSRLFERFYQVDPSMTRAVSGVGLGLSISRALIEAHGGRIGVESELGKGSLFWFELPTHTA